MKIAVTGASGLIGSALVPALRADGHEVVRFVRSRADAPDERSWHPDARRLDPSLLTDVDAVVHLAGAGVGDHRWTESYKRTLLDSRVDGTTTLARAVAAARTPRVLLSSSGINYYGDTGDRLTDETGPLGEGFLADICRQWERSTAVAADAGVRVAHLRSGVVLSGAGGALRKQLPIFKAGLGAPLGNGRQWFSWISMRDEVDAIRHLLTADVSGPVNLVAPNPVTNREFTEVLGRKVLRRPTLPIPVPAFALRLGLGEIVDDVVVAGQRIAPGVLERTGFAFAHPHLEDALRVALGREA